MRKQASTHDRSPPCSEATTRIWRRSSTFPRCFYRLGFDANLTLGNKKSVDIAVVLGPGRAITIDVKAVAGKMDWLMGSSPDQPKPNHYVVLVSYDGRFGDSLQAPRCWVLRHGEVLPLVKTASGKGRMRYLSRKAVLDGFGSREGAWRLLGESPT